MTDTDTLTFSQGTRIMIEIVVFTILYFIYLKLMNPDKPFFIDLVVTSGLFALWLFSIAIIGNIAISLTVPSSREAPVGRVATDPDYRSLFP